MLAPPPERLSCSMTSFLPRRQLHRVPASVPLYHIPWVLAGSRLGISLDSFCSVAWVRYDDRSIRKRQHGIHDGQVYECVWSQKPEQHLV